MSGTLSRPASCSALAADHPLKESPALVQQRDVLWIAGMGRRTGRVEGQGSLVLRFLFRTPSFGGGGVCTSTEFLAPYSSTAGSLIPLVRTHSLVPSTFTAAWVCFAKNRVSGYTSIQISLFPSFWDSSKISCSPQCRCVISILFKLGIKIFNNSVTSFHSSSTLPQNLAFFTLILLSSTYTYSC